MNIYYDINNRVLRSKTQFNKELDSGIDWRLSNYLARGFYFLDVETSTYSREVMNETMKEFLSGKKIK